MDFTNIEKLSYVKDKIKGNHFYCSVLNNYGWVEMLKENLTNVYYYSSMPMRVFQQHKKSTQLLVALHTNQNSDQDDTEMPAKNLNGLTAKGYGLLHTLAQVRLNGKFIMPLFASQKDSDVRITCGTNRLMACYVNGIEANDIPMILLSSTLPTHNGWQKIESTQQFNELLNFDDLDYGIGININKREFQVLNSVIRHTIYDSPDQLKLHIKTSNKILNFWKKSLSETNNKIDITIWCTEETKALIEPSKWFNISYVIKQPFEWQFSFGKMVGAQADTSTSTRLNLYLFDIVESVNLNLLLVWPTEEYGTFYSKNCKSILIDMDHKSTFVIIGNWVK
jgi:hypothetical protein